MIDFDSAYDDGEYVWFVGKKDNFLYCMNRDYKIMPIVLIPYTNLGFRETPRCIKYDSKIICLPDKGNKIIIYDIVSKTFDDIDVQINNNRTSILNAHMYNGMLWCVSYSSGEILKCNIMKCNVEERYRVMDECKHNFNGETKLVDNILYLVNKTNHQFMTFNLDTQQCETVTVGCKERGFSTITVLKNNVYLTGYDKKIYCYNLGNGFTTSLDTMGSWMVDNTDATCPRFHQSIACGKYIVFTPLNSNDFLTDGLAVFNTECLETSIYKLNDHASRHIDQNIVMLFNDDECISVHDELLNKLACIDLKSGDIGVKTVIKECFQPRRFGITSGAIYQESFGLDLVDYVEAIMSKGDAK